MHHSFHAVETELIGNVGTNFLLPIWSMANVAQGGAALAVSMMTKNKKLKAVAAPASFSCLLGITEAAIFGVNLRLVKRYSGGNRRSAGRRLCCSYEGRNDRNRRYGYPGNRHSSV